MYSINMKFALDRIICISYLFSYCVHVYTGAALVHSLQIHVHVKLKYVFYTKTDVYPLVKAVFNKLYNV